MNKILILASLFIFILSSCSQNDKKEALTTGDITTSKNTIVENILNRRSVRKYKPAQVQQPQLDSIIKCGVHAPSALNKQSWEVRVIQNPELLTQINNAFIDDAKGKSLPGSASKAQEPGFSVFHNAPTLIVVAKDKDNPYGPVDCGLFTQNILLSAESMNIGTCVVGSVANILNSDKRLKEAINLDDNHEVVLGIAMGYTDESPKVKDRDMNKVQYIK